MSPVLTLEKVRPAKSVRDGIPQLLLFGTGISFPESLNDHPKALQGIEGFAGERPVGISNMSRRGRAMVQEVQEFLGQGER